MRSPMAVLLGLTLLAGKAAVEPDRHVGPFVVRSVQGPAFKVRYPVIVSGPPGTEALKKTLEDLGRERARGCASGPEDDLFEYESSVVYADETFFTVETSESFECGAPHRNYHRTVRSYLVASGALLERTDLVDASLSREEITRIARERGVAVSQEGDCSREAYRYEAAVVGDGVRFTVDYPYAAILCEFDVTLPRDSLKRYLRGSLAR